MKPTQKHEILKALALSSRPLAVHEFDFDDISQNSIATRLSELQKAGLVVGEYKPGRPYKVWKLAGESLPIGDAVLGH
jgi:DNA-binding HxlR family transcriptional regulator